MSKLTLDDRLLILSFWNMAEEFMRNPAHRADFKEWQAKRHGAQTAANETHAMPTERPATGAAATV